MNLTQLLDLVRQHGDAAYAFVFAYAAWNSLLMVLFAGYAAHMSALDWGKLILVCWAGSFTGDAVHVPHDACDLTCVNGLRRNGAGKNKADDHSIKQLFHTT